MHRGFWVFVLLGVIGVVLAAKSPSGVFSTQDKDNTLQLLQRGRQKDGSYLGLKNTYFATQTYGLLKTSVPTKDQTCDYVSKALKSFNAEDIFYVASIESALSCASSVATNTKAITALNEVLQSNSAELKDLSFAFNAALLISAKNKKAFPELAKAEKKLLALAEEDGQFLPRANADLGTIYGTGFALETLANFVASGAPVSDAIKTALTNAKQIFDLIVEDDKSGVAYFEDVESKDTNVKVSAAYFSGLAQLAAQAKVNLDVDKEQIIALAEYFVVNKNPSSLESIFYVVKGLSAIAKNPIYVPMVLTLESSTLSAKGNKDLHVSVTDIFGNPAEKAKVTLETLKPQGSPTSVLSKVSLEASKNSKYEVSDLLSKAKVTSGVLNAEFTVDPVDEKFLTLEKVVRRIKVLGTISVADAKVTISAASAKDSEGVATKVGDFPNKLKETLKFNGNRKLTVEFKVKEGTNQNARVHQAFVKVSCDKCGEEVTVPAKYSDKGYTATLKLEDIASKLSQQSGVYEIELIVADASAATGVSWKFGKVDITFEKAPVARETPFTPHAVIEHQFRPADKRAPRSLASIFTIAVLAVPWLVLLSGWMGLGVNFKNFPTGASFLDAVIFQGCIGAALFLYWSYWIGMTMFTTLTYLGLLCVPGVFFGQRALNSFADKQKKD